MASMNASLFKQLCQVFTEMLLKFKLVVHQGPFVQNFVSLNAIVKTSSCFKSKYKFVIFLLIKCEKTFANCKGFSHFTNRK